jgi:serine/threonine-protein kinase
VAAFQEDPVAETADMLGLTRRERDRRVLTVGGTTVPRAFDNYIIGLGRLWAAQDDSTDHTSDAIALLEEATAMDPSFTLAHADLGRAHWKAFEETRDPEEKRKAVESAQRAVELDDRIAAAHVTLGLIEDHAGNYAAAAEECGRALDIDRVNPRARQLLAKVSVSEGKFTLAKEIHKDAVDDRPKHWAPHYALGVYYRDRGQVENALREMREASTLARGNAVPYIGIGVVYLDTDLFDEACVQLDRARELEPTRYMRFVYSLLGSCHFIQSRYADAISMYKKALEEDESRYVSWGNLAAAYNAAYDVVPGGEERAAECYAQALELGEEELELDPRNAGLLASLASYSAELGDSARAWDYLGRSMELHPEDDAVMFEIGLTHELLDDRDTALDWIGRAVEEGFSSYQVEHTPDLRDLCTDDRYQRQVQRGGGR